MITGVSHEGCIIAPRAPMAASRPELDRRSSPLGELRPPLKPSFEPRATVTLPYLAVSPPRPAMSGQILLLVSPSFVSGLLSFSMTSLELIEPWSPSITVVASRSAASPRSPHSRSAKIEPPCLASPPLRGPSPPDPMPPSPPNAAPFSANLAEQSR